MPLNFGDHDDVVFRNAPLLVVLCQIRFSPILALLDRAGVLGLQEALRPQYPFMDGDFEAQVKVSDLGAEFSKTAPVWRFRDAEKDYKWQVSIALDFVALETTEYSSISEFIDRFENLLVAAERTVHPSPSRRIGVRKVNVLRHPDVRQPSDWATYLRSELVGVTGLTELPGTVTGSYSETHIDDGENGTLSLRYGIDPEDSTAFRLDMDYWTSRPFDISAGGLLPETVRDYSDSMTNLFHWGLRPSMYTHLDPVPRSSVQGGQS